jgi:hypothetical protein
MPKRPLKITARIPAYRYPRNEWRKAIHQAVQRRAGRVQYEDSDKLEVEILLYMEKRGLGWNDVDNRSKDVLNALQGRAGGPKRSRRLEAIIPNDRQIYRVIVEKQTPPPQSQGLGHVKIRRLGKIRVVRFKRA